MWVKNPFKKKFFNYFFQGRFYPDVCYMNEKEREKNYLTDIKARVGGLLYRIQ